MGIWNDLPKDVVEVDIITIFKGIWTAIQIVKVLREIGQVGKLD